MRQGALGNLNTSHLSNCASGVSTHPIVLSCFSSCPTKGAEKHREQPQTQVSARTQVLEHQYIRIHSLNTHTQTHALHSMEHTLRPQLCAHSHTRTGASMHMQVHFVKHTPAARRAALGMPTHTACGVGRTRARPQGCLRSTRGTRSMHSARCSAPGAPSPGCHQAGPPEGRSPPAHPARRARLCVAGTGAPPALRRPPAGSSLAGPSVHAADCVTAMLLCTAAWRDEHAHRSVPRGFARVRACVCVCACVRVCVCVHACVCVLVNVQGEQHSPIC